MSLRAATSFLAIAIALAFVPPAAAETASPEGAKVYFISPKDGDEISGPLTIKFGLSGMGVAPAGIEKPKTGHHHLLIDVDKVDMDNPLPADEHHKHFGGGQTETTITLPAGKHTLQLILGDHNHVPHKPPVMSDKITVTVK